VPKGERPFARPGPSTLGFFHFCHLRHFVGGFDEETSIYGKRNVKEKLT
jgi:hypothetical protein